MRSIKLVIKRLGPIKNSEIELGNVTLFMGPPNTGKSYALKALYSKLLPLDAYGFNVAIQTMKNNMSKILLERYFERLTHLHKSLEDALLKLLIILAIAVINELDPKTLEEVLKSFRGKPFEDTLTLMGDEIVATISAKFSIDKTELERVKRLCIRKIVRNLIPACDLRCVTLEPFDFEKTEVPVEALAGTVNTVKDVSDKLRVVTTSILSKIFKYYIEKGTVETERFKTLLQMFTNEIKANLGVSVTVRGENASIIITLFIGPIISGTLRKKDTKAVLEEILELERNLKDEVEPFLILLTTDLNATVLRAIGEGFSKPLCRMIKGMTEASLGFEEVRFIPFGRTPIVLAIEGVSREPLERIPVLEKLMKLYPINLSSYVYWASEGRRLLLENELDETKEKILTLVAPLIEGKLLHDKRNVLYEDWRGSKVSLRLTSALVEEVTGMLFPILSLSSNNSLVLVEEPEAQLHPQAQVVSALFLASLPSLCCKVVATTHSDLIALTLSYLVVKKPNYEQLVKLLRSLVPHISYNVEELAKQASQSIKDLDLKIYEFTRDGSVKPVEPETVLSKEVPSITRVIDVLTEWAFELTR